MDVGFFDDDTGEVKIYRSTDSDPNPTHPEWHYFMKPGEEDEPGIYYLFKEKEFETFTGYIEIFKEDGVVMHCDLYRPAYPIQSYLDIGTVYGIVE